MVFQSRENGVKSSLNFKRSQLSPEAKIKKSEAAFCRSAFLLSFCENRFCLSQLIKKLNSTERGALFRHFCVSKVITTAHAHKSGVIFHIQFSRAVKQKKIKALRPKMTKIPQGGGPALRTIFQLHSNTAWIDGTGFFFHTFHWLVNHIFYGFRAFPCVAYVHAYRSSTALNKNKMARV